MENGAVEQKLRELGYALPARPEGGGSYVHVKEFGDGLAYVSGCGPELDGALAFRGQVGAEVSLEEARQCAVHCVLNVLSALKLHLGSLDRVKNFVKMTVFVACPPGQADIPRAADGATWLLEQLFGRERGVPTRTTVGVTALADHFPVELEVLVELYK